MPCDQNRPAGPDALDSTSPSRGAAPGGEHPCPAPGPATDAAVLFSGDTGLLPADTRQVLVQLLLGPYVDGARQGRLWAVLLRDERVLRSRLHDLFLELVVAHDERVAFVRQVIEEDLEAPILLRRQPLTFVETALLLYLRQCLTQAQAQGERAVVSRDEMLEHLLVYERERNPDRAKFERQCVSAVKKAHDANWLRPLRASGERFEVSPTLRLLFPAEEIAALLAVYRSLAARQSDASQAAGAVAEVPGQAELDEDDEAAEAPEDEEPENGWTTATGPTQ